jgi:hypothetical protein
MFDHGRMNCATVAIHLCQRKLFSFSDLGAGLLELFSPKCHRSYFYEEILVHKLYEYSDMIIIRVENISYFCA